MDLLEYKQIEESIKYIEDYMLNKKYSDEELDNMLKEFQTSDSICDAGTNKWKIPRYYNNGLSSVQLYMIRGILLSTDYNYSKFEKKYAQQKERIEKDVEKDTYKGKTLEDYEKMRLEAINKINSTEDFAEKLKILKGYSLKINEGIKKLAEYKLVKETVVSDMIAEAAEKMINCGFSLTQITNYLQTDPLSIYYLAKSIEKPFNLSPEEEELIKNAEKKVDDELAILGESGLPKENNNPYCKFKTWEAAVSALKNALSVQNNIEIYSSSPLTSDMFMKDFDVVIDIKYETSEFYCANNAFNILKECLFPSGFGAVTNRGHMLLYSKNSKKREDVNCIRNHTVYKTGVWHI